MASRLFAQHLCSRPDAATFPHPQLVSGVLPTSEHATRHFWLEIDGAVVDLTADAFGEAAVMVGPRTAFHQSLTSPITEDAASVLASLTADEIARLERQLSVIESRLSQFPSAAV